MKAIELKDFKPNKRSIARDMWGEVSNSLPTTERRASFYVTPSHGGYVCNPKDFTDREREVMGEPNYHLNLCIVVSRYSGIEYVIGVDHPYSQSRRIRVPMGYYFKEWRKYPMYVFEEDCAWAILTYATGITLKELLDRYSKENLNKNAITTLKDYYPEVLKK